MTDQTMKELAVLKRMEKDYDLSATTVMVIQTHMMVRDLLNDMTSEQAVRMRGIDLKGILALTSASIPSWDPMFWDGETIPKDAEDPNGGWRGMPGWVRTRKPKTLDEEPTFE